MQLFSTSVHRPGMDALLPKVQQLVSHVSNDIASGVLKPGDRLPSINDTSTDWYISRDTVERAYHQLTRLGLVTSVSRRGYFVTGQKAQRMLLLVGQLTPSVWALYKSLQAVWGSGYQVELQCYNYQSHYLEELLGNHLATHHTFVLLPQLIDMTPVLQQTIRKIPRGRLIVLNGHFAELATHQSFIDYASGQGLNKILDQRLTCLKKYRRLRLVMSEKEFVESDWIQTFVRFADTWQFDFQVVDSVDEESMALGTVYFTVDDDDLLLLVRKATEQHLTLGHDLGIISFGDSGFKEVIADGVSVITANYEQLARSIADTLQRCKPSSSEIPMRYIQRQTV